MKHLVLISCRGVADQGDRLVELAQLMGVPARRITIGEEPAMAELGSEIGGRDACVAISMQSLAALRERATPDGLCDLVANGCATLLVYSAGGSPPRHHADLLPWLTGGAVAALSSPQARHEFHLPEQGRPFSRAFAGQGFGARQAEPLPVFELGEGERSGIDNILLADQQPVFLRMQRGSCELFVLAVAEIPHVNVPLSANRGIDAHYAQLIPLLIFLRHCFGDVCWHGAVSMAHLIIDDPLLKPTYGFLDFGALRESMRATGYATSIAFIPWNHWRTSKETATGIFMSDPNLSICVHGCDHSNREFSEVEPAPLQCMSDMALERMDRHERRTGLPYDAVMVFPQGNFSSAAMRALRTSGYVAAVNTTCFPTDAEAEALTIADFLRPAVTKFHGFALFQRRYPGRLIDFAFDAFLGRPILIVQHHQDFRGGPLDQEAFVRALVKMEPDLVWGSLAELLTQSCVVRRSSEDAMEVRFFTPRFRFRNPHAAAVRLSLFKPERDPSRIEAVQVNGRDVVFTCSDGLLTFEHQAGPGQSVDVAVRDKPRPATRGRRPLRMRHTAEVCVRRALSEFRDLTLARHPRLLSAATQIAARMKVTGDNAGKPET